MGCDTCSSMQGITALFRCVLSSCCALHIDIMCPDALSMWICDAAGPTMHGAHMRTCCMERLQRPSMPCHACPMLLTSHACTQDLLPAHQYQL